MYLDIIIVAILVIMPFCGLKKGLVLSCVGVLGAMFCFVLTFKITPVFVNFVEVSTNIPQFVSKILSGANNSVINFDINSKFFAVISSILSLKTTQFTVNRFLIGVFCFIFIYIFTKLCVGLLLKKVSRIVSVLPVVGKINNILGLVLGVAKAFVLIFVMCAIVMIMSKIPEIGDVLSGQMENSSFYNVFSEASASIVDAFLNIVKM